MALSEGDSGGSFGRQLPIEIKTQETSYSLPQIGTFGFGVLVWDSSRIENTLARKPRKQRR